MARALGDSVPILLSITTRFRAMLAGRFLLACRRWRWRHIRRAATAGNTSGSLPTDTGLFAGLSLQRSCSSPALLLAAAVLGRGRTHAAFGVKGTPVPPSVRPVLSAWCCLRPCGDCVPTVILGLAQTFLTGAAMVLSCGATAGSSARLDRQNFDDAPIFGTAICAAATPTHCGAACSLLGGRYVQIPPSRSRAAIGRAAKTLCARCIHDI